jgi:hypothetical protein
MLPLIFYGCTKFLETETRLNTAFHERNIQGYTPAVARHHTRVKEMLTKLMNRKYTLQRVTK